MLGLVLFTSDYGITAGSCVNKSFNTTAAHVVRPIPCANTQSVMLTGFFVAQAIRIGEQKINPKSGIF